MWLPEDLCEGRRSVTDEVVPMAPEYRYSFARLFFDPRFLSMGRVWHWDDGEGESWRFVVWYKDAQKWTQATQAHLLPLDAVREALEALDVQGGPHA